MSGIKTSKRKHPPLEKLFRVCDALIESGVREVTFLGGDPALYSGVVTLAEYCTDRGLAVSILSNTHRYPGSSITEAAKYISAFETTIHASTPSEHDAFCHSNGAYNSVLTQLQTAASLGRKVGIAINVTPDSAGIIFNIAKAVVHNYKIPLDYIIVQRIIPFGRAQTTSDFTISKEHAERSLHDIERIDKELGIRITVEDPFPLCVLPSRLRRYMNPCQWGFTKAAVNEDGDLSRCGADPRYLLGNILETPLLEIWNNSPILASFRNRKYLPGRCLTCSDLSICGGGCPLSCEIEKDHGLDYLFLEYQRVDAEIHGRLTFGKAREEELSSILQIEWSDFPEYGHIFSVASIREWYGHNPDMFYVLRDTKSWVMAYACVVPVTEKLHQSICEGKYTALTDFPKEEVLRSGNTPFYHLEVVASVPIKSSSRVGKILIKEVGSLLINAAKHITASPVTDIGVRLCNHFNFKIVSYEHVNQTDTHSKKYPVFYLDIDDADCQQKLDRF